MCINLYTRKNVRKLPVGMLKRLFSKSAVPKVGENSIFFIVLYLSTDQSRNYAGREICFLIFEGEDLEFWRQSPPKINGVNLKNYFDEKNKISKKSKFKSESPSFFQKRNQKIENLGKNSVNLVYLIDLHLLNVRFSRSTSKRWLAGIHDI